MKTLMNIARGLAAKEAASQLEEKHLALALHYVEFVDRANLDALCAWIGVAATEYDAVVSGGDELAKLGSTRIVILQRDVQALMSSVPFAIDIMIGTPSAGSFNENAVKRFQPCAYKLPPIPRPSEDPLPRIPQPAGDPINFAKKLREALGEQVIGQDDVLDLVCGALAESGKAADRRGPAAAFLFAGPSGCGKSLLADQLADLLQKSESFYRVDMSAFRGYNDFGLTGLRYGFTDARPGELTSFVRHHPNAVVVLENIDRAHPLVQDSLLPILTRGILRDEYWAGFSHDGAKKTNNPFTQSYQDGDKERPPADVDFRETIVIFTTNEGGMTYDLPVYNDAKALTTKERAAMVVDALSGGDEKDNSPHGVCTKLSANMLTALLGYEVAPFVRLNFASMRKLAAASLKKAAYRFANISQAKVWTTQITELIDLFLFSQGGSATPRSIGGKAARAFLFDAVARDLGNGVNLEGKDVSISLLGDSLKRLNEIRLELGDEPLRTLFRKNRLLTFAVKVDVRENEVAVHYENLALLPVRRATDYGGQGSMQVDIPEVTFDDIAGHNEAKARLRQTAQLLKQRDLLVKLKVDAPRGILLYGPPGTGKTMLAKAFSNEADLPFMAIGGSEMRDIDLMRKIFVRLRRYAPSVLFIDEIDALGKRGESSYGDAVINQLLTEIDGFGCSLTAPVFVIGATNLPEKLDAALIRSGRMDLKIEIKPLDRTARAIFVDRYRAIPGLEAIDAQRIVQNTSGLSGADMEMVRRETVLELARKNLVAANETLLLEKINETRSGRRAESVQSEGELARTAFHEAGHAIVAKALMPEMKIEEVTIAPRGNTLGGIRFDTEDMPVRSSSRDEVLNRMCMFLAGRVAETQCFGSVGCNDGAAQDLRRATELAYRAVFCWGLDEELGVMAMAAPDVMVPDLSTLPEWSLKRIRSWLDEAHQLTASVVEQRWPKIHRVAKQLLVGETLAGFELEIEISRACEGVTL